MSTAEMVHVNGTPGLAKVDLSTRFNEEQRRLILDTCCGGASENDARALLAIAEARGLNPILGECYFVERKGKWAVQASIDSLRIKAEQTGLYAGQDEPEYEYNKEGLVTLSRVRVWRRDWTRPAVGVARWDEYVQTTSSGQPSKFWAQMPHNQLSKCAEALALRKAFPAVLGKLYVAEEMEQADNVTPVAAPRQIAQTYKAPELPAAKPSDLRVFLSLCKRIDTAENMGPLNKVAADTRKAYADKLLIEADYVHIVRAHRAKAEMLTGERPSQPKAADREAGEEG